MGLFGAVVRMESRGRRFDRVVYKDCGLGSLGNFGQVRHTIQLPAPCGGATNDSRVAGTPERIGGSRRIEVLGLLDLGNSKFSFFDVLFRVLLCFGVCFCSMGNSSKRPADALSQTRPSTTGPQSSCPVVCGPVVLFSRCLVVAVTRRVCPKSGKRGC